MKENIRRTFNKTGTTSFKYWIYFKRTSRTKEEDTQKIDVLIDQNEDLKQNIEETNDKLDSVVEKLGIAVEDRAPRLKRASIRERFVLFKKNILQMKYINIMAHSWTKCNM